MDYSMSKNRPPENYLWSHIDVGEQDGDGVVSYANVEAKREWRRIRREWLSNFHLNIAEEPERGYRYWRWSDDSGKVVWWERRPWKEVFTGEPGFWPS